MAGDLDLTGSDAVRDNRLRFMMLPPKRTKYDTVFQPEESKSQRGFLLKDTKREFPENMNTPRYVTPRLGYVVDSRL